jgi:hypothetical protein
MGQLSAQEIRSIVATSATVGRRAYVAPHLLQYGSVAKLTQSGTGSMVDACNTKSKNNDSMCSVALPQAPAKMR